MRACREGRRRTQARALLPDQPEFWINLQALHDRTKARTEHGAAIEHDVNPRAA